MKSNSTLTFRRSCREGVCGSCAMTVNGKNTLVCTKAIDFLFRHHQDISLPHLQVIKDLVPDMTHFYAQYASSNPGSRPKLRRPPIPNVCKAGKTAKNWTAYMTASCAPAALPAAPVTGGTAERYLGPAILLQAYRCWWTAVTKAPARLTSLKTLQTVPMPHHHELHRYLPQRPESRQSHRRNQKTASAKKAGLMNELARLNGSAGAAPKSWI